jgi:hypothetical protein
MTSTKTPPIFCVNKGNEFHAYRRFCAFVFSFCIVPSPVQQIYSQPLQITPHKKITITEPGQQNKPVYAAISVNAQKDIYLTDIALNRILRINSTGMLIREVVNKI